MSSRIERDPIMPKYRIISEIDPMAEHRISRGARAAVKTGAPAQRLVTIVGAMDITDAALNLHREMPDYEDHEDRRVISIEEIHPGFTVTDEQITNALTSPEGEWTNEPMVDPKSSPRDSRSTAAATSSGPSTPWPKPCANPASCRGCTSLCCR